MTAKELYDFLNDKIPESLSCDWDNDGLMCCPGGGAEVKRVLIALDITDRVAEYAIKNGFDTVISHHPLIFFKISHLNELEGTPRKLIKLIKNGITAMSFHTRLDAADGGVNDILAELLGIGDVQKFGPNGEEELGRIGYLPETVSLEEFCNTVKARLSCPAISYADAGRRVHKVALLGGDGKDFVDAAVYAGADTYISGRISYNLMIEAPEKNINLIEAGHFFTENPVCHRLEALVCEADGKIETEIINSNGIKVI